MQLQKPISITCAKIFTYQKVVHKYSNNMNLGTPQSHPDGSCEYFFGVNCYEIDGRTNETS